MKKNLTELLMILDRSGSMSGLESDTIVGYNGMLKKQRETEGEVLVSTVLFDDRIEVPHDCVTLDKVSEISEKDYYVRGCTALLDAVGSAIHHIGNVHKYAQEEDRSKETIYVITTVRMEKTRRKNTSIQLFIKLQLISILCYTSTDERYNSNEQGKITVT